MTAAAPRAISISEFFVRNRHLLGLETPARALLSAVKEAVDNALDACDEARILPEVWVDVARVEADIFRVAVTDNGPGVAERQIAKIFARLLYGSKFHVLRQSRGQQGLGISAVGMYGQLTTGRPMRVLSRTSARKPAWEFLLSLDTAKNRPVIHRRARADWTVAHGTRVEIDLLGAYHRGARSVEEFLRQTAIANPHATIHFEDPDGANLDLPRSVRRRPRSPTSMRPHPHGLELGRLTAMLEATRRRTLGGFLQHELSRVGPATAAAIVANAGPPLRDNTSPRSVTHGQARALHHAIEHTRISAPSAACIVPIGEPALRRSLQERVAAELYATVTRPPAVYRGHPFQVEVALAWGGEGGDRTAQVLRFSNRTPMLFAARGCAMTQAVVETNWSAYGVTHPRGALPQGPLVILLHLASVWVPYTSESKEAIAAYPEIEHELRLALQACGRRLGQHLARLRRDRDADRRRRAVERYVPHIGLALQDLLDLPESRRAALVTKIERVLRHHEEVRSHARRT